MENDPIICLILINHVRNLFGLVGLAVIQVREIFDTINIRQIAHISTTIQTYCTWFRVSIIEN